MSNQKVITPNPELRFKMADGSQFNDWKIVPLKSIAKRQTKKNTDAKIARVLTNSAIGGILDQKDYFKKDIAVVGNLQGYYVVDKNDYVYNPRISAEAPAGPISKNKIDKGVMSPLYTVFRFNNEKGDFYEQFFKSSKWHHYLKAVSNTGARHDRMSISSKNFMEMPVPKPSEKEQHKISEFLSNTDVLINAEIKKLKELINHKKGLVRQLLPSVENTLPIIRFPEFATEWKSVKLGDIAKVTTGNKDTQNKVEKGKYPFFVRSQTIAKIDSYTYDCEAILTSGDGVGVGKNYHYINGKFDFHQRVYCIYDFEKKALGKFIYLYFSEYFNQRVKKLSAKNSVDSVRMSMITEMTVILPSIEEQKKIADFLFSIDKVIAGQKRKVDNLKSHKKGLTQQLFPTLFEAEV